jgi:hypothetical protein
MISCRLAGGLGNLMFQIAGFEYIAHSSGLTRGYWNTDLAFRGLNAETDANPNMKHANDYLTMFKNFHWPKCNKPETEVYVPFHYTPINAKDNVEYIGYFQSEQYFPNREFILNLFQPSDNVNKQILKYNKILEGNTCSIHIRRGDYLKEKNSIHAVRGLDYYQKGINVIGEVDRYLIFSDDIHWCKQNFIGDKFVFIENEKDYIEIFLQSRCNHNIISSSSFSWWGAYLNNKNNRKIVGPKDWFANLMKNNIMPKEWITI